MKLDTFICNAHAMLENNMAFFSKKADDGRKLRSKQLTRYFEGISRNPRGHAVLEWRVPSASDPEKNYQCYISVEPKRGTLFVLASAKGRIGEKIQLIKDADVRCFCTCPDFNWSGAKYNMKHRYDGYDEGHTSDEGVPDGSDIRPRIKDPKGRNTVCKHLLASFNGIMLNASTIMKAARTAKFPKEYSEEEPQQTVLDHDNEQEYDASGKITALNGDNAENAPSGEIKAANSEEKKPIMDYPSEDEAIKILGESSPVKVPEAQEALDALANTLGEPENNGEQSTDGDITAFNSDSDEKTKESGSEISMFNGDGQKFNPLTDIEDAAKLPMFNPGPSDEDELT